MNFLCDNVFHIQKEEFNSFGLGGIGYDLFFFQDWILDENDDEFKLLLTKRAREKVQHEVGLRFKIDGSDTDYKNQHEKLNLILIDHADVFQMYLVTISALVAFCGM